MADESEQIGGISVSLGANDGKLISDLAEAERLVQNWAKQAATVQLRANFAGGAGTPGAGGGGDLSALTKAIEQGFANFSAKPPARPTGPSTPRFSGASLPTPAAAPGGMSAYARQQIAAELAKTGEVYDELNNEIGKVTTSHRAQRTAVEASTRSVRQETEAPVPTVDTGALQAEIKAAVSALGELVAATTQASKELYTALGGLADRAVGPAAPAAGGGGKRRRGAQARAAAAAPEGDEEEEGRLGFQTRMAAFELREGDRHRAVVQRRRVSAGQLAFRESERQRVREVAATRAQYAELESLADDFFSGEEKRIGKKEDQASLQALSDQAQAANNAPRPAPAATPVAATRSNETAAQRQSRERDERDQAAALAANAPRPRRAPNVAANATRAAQQRQEELFNRTRPGVVSAEQREENIQARIEAGRANITAATSTGRTSASRLGSTFLGTGGRRLEVDTRAAEARRELTAANRAALPFERELATLNEDIANSSGRVRAANTAARDSFKADPRVVEVFQRQEKAIRGVADATREYEKLQSGGNIVRNLGAIALGSFAFSAALKAVDLAVATITPVLGDFIDLQTGYASKSTAITTALAKQTAEQRGNVDAVVAQAAVTAGLSEESAKFLSTQLKLTTQVKAGALAQQQSSDLFRAASGTQQSGVPQGLGGGFGGIGGTPFLAQQLGGGKGLQEILAGDINALSKNRNKTGEFGDVPGTVNDILGSLNPFGENFANPGKQVDVRRNAAAQSGPTPVLQKEIDDLNAAMTRGATATGQSVSASYKFTSSQTDIARAIEVSKAAGDDLGAGIAALGYIMVDAKGNVADFQSQLKSLTQAGIGKGIPEPAELGALALAQEQQRQREAAASIPALLSKQAYERPAFLAQQERQQQFQLQTQLPAQQALQNLSNPFQPVGTGIASANAKEQDRIVEGQKRSVELQSELNAGYAEGKQILIDTYKVPAQLVQQVAAIGNEIASTQAGIRNEQAAYQVAQYNFQLHIAKRSLSDIGGLTGKNFGAGQSYLGSLEKQNLALSRQGQLLQFNLSQRQINFQTALAGFQTPGVTPEERQARVKEAQIEAGFAQKQLDISKQIFGNQVQIVDIQNLRQGADLAAQIGLLLQGRKVTIDTAQAEERLALLNKLQAQQVAKVGTYIQKVDTLVGKAFADINALETAAGKAMAGIAVQVLTQYALVIRGISTQLNAGANSGNYTEADRQKNKSGAHASGIVGTTTGTTNMTIGEAGSETYAILRNPRSMMASLGGGGGVSVTFGNVYVRSEADIDDITRKVTKALGRDAALKGLRSNG